MESASESTARRPHHLARIAARLAGIDGVACLPGQGDEVSASSDAARTLAQVLAAGPLDVATLLEMAAHLSLTLQAIHRCGVLHHNISPEQILLHRSGRLPMLTGFDLASTFTAERPVFKHHREIQGNLAYLAPEQTGRTGRSVDLRADLYSLGATLYEASTGHRPFDSEDPLQLLHDHLVRPPAAPVLLRPELPGTLSQIILRLLEKEPERRYQSADGVAHDLAQVRRALAHGDTAPLVLGEHDFPMQLSAPSRLVGRSTEIGLLRDALDKAVRGQGGTVLVSGAPGVGKTSLINELRPMVTARRGWFVSGKFDQYRQDAPTASVQALRALGRLLLVEPAAELASERERILHALGANAGLVCNLPEFALLLGPQLEVPAADPAQAEARLLVTVVSLLRAIACPQRPVVMVLDDLQWAAPVSLRFIEVVIHSADLPGFLLVGSYRDSEVDPAHPLATALARWRRCSPAPLEMRLDNLRGEYLQEMLGAMMRLPPVQAATLARAVGEHTGGNPYDTVELLNALRQDGTLRCGPQGWDWDAATLRQYVGRQGVLELLSARITRLPPPGQRLLQVMACLGGQVRRGVLCAAAGLDTGSLDDQLAAPLEDGLLVSEGRADGDLRMRHDRVQQAVYGTLEPMQRRALHLTLARRLAANPEFSAVAVEQYLPVYEDIADPQECRRVACLMRERAAGAKGVANYALAQRLLAAALALVSRIAEPTADDERMHAVLEVDLHMALCTLGRFEEADSLYAVIENRGAAEEQWIGAACAQVDSLHNRSRSREAVTLGLCLVKQIGLAVPDDFEAANIEERLANLREWASHIDLGSDRRPYTGDSRCTALVMLLNRLSYPAYFTNIRIMAWVILECQIIWAQQGPSPALVPALASLGGVAISVNEDYQTGYRGARHALLVSEARGWEPSTAEARLLVAVHACHWFEPLEHTMAQLLRAREGLLRNGELQSACYTYRPSTTAMLACSASLEGLAQEIEAGLGLAFRLRSEYIIAMLTIEGQLLRWLRGEPDPGDAAWDDAQACLQRQTMLPAVSLSIHFTRALFAALFGDAPALAHHAKVAMGYVASLASFRAAEARVLQTFALALQAGTAVGRERQTLLAEFEIRREWLARRSVDAPSNFLHLLTWIDAERAWAMEDFSAAAGAFDAALCQVESLTRPWHHALIAERAGLFHLKHGMNKSGQQFLAQAHRLYHAWGAKAKVLQLQKVHAFLANQSSAPLESISAADTNEQVDTIDTLAILRASQALGSETSLARLKSRISDVMGALTGATAVQLALWDEDMKDWYLSKGEGAEAKRIGAGDVGARGLLPLSAFRYAERTREPLLVEDATRDDRFARDPYLSGVAHCSLLIVPILNQGSPLGMLLLENRLSRGAFSTGRLDAVTLIAGQLAVSLENALLYDRLEQRVREQTHELLAAARRSGMAQIATNVLHNVGNVLTSVNVSAHVLEARISQSRMTRVADLASLFESNARDLASFLADSEKGRRLPSYMRELAEALKGEREELLGELGRLAASVDHIKNVVAMQQSYAGASGMLELADITELAEDALRIQEDALAHKGIRVVREYAPVGQVALEKTRVMQILVNLFENARQAMEGAETDRTLGVRVTQDSDWLCVSVSDDGCGIPAANLPRIFSHGFTTKPDGHGFGLHSCALAAKEIGGTLSVHSEGQGKGSTFTLRLPFERAVR